MDTLRAIYDSLSPRGLCLLSIGGYVRAGEADNAATVAAFAAENQLPWPHAADLAAIAASAAPGGGGQRPTGLMREAGLYW